MISGLVFLSNPIKFCYPWQESITSFLPVVDELVVVHNPLSTDNSREALEEFAKGRPIRIVSGPFDLLKYGWVSYGIVRTIGYHACKGDIVAMFDADGVLHENDVARLKEQLQWIQQGAQRDFIAAYWAKYRLFKPDLYWDQNKHSGLYHKGRLGDRFDFFRVDAGEIKGAPNVDRIKSNERFIQFDAKLFGYEHLWDTEEVIRFKTNAYGQMIDRQHGKEFKTPEEYFNLYIEELEADLEKKGKKMDISKHPKIIQEKLASLNETHFGYNFFGLIK